MKVVVSGLLLLTLISVLHVRYRKATGYTLQGWLFLYNLASDSVLIFATLRLGPESQILVPLIPNVYGYILSLLANMRFRVGFTFMILILT